MKIKLARAVDWLLYAGVVGMILLLVSRKMSGPDEGKPAELFELPVVGEPGERFRLADHRGKPVLIEVFAGWCGACQRAMPAVQQAWEQHGREGRVTFVAVSLDEPDEAKRVKREWRIPYAVAVDDGTMSPRYEIEVLPTFVLVDRDGIVRHVSTGAPSSAEVAGWISEL